MNCKKIIIVILTLFVSSWSIPVQNIPKEKYPVFTNTIYLNCTNYVPGYCDVVYPTFETFFEDADISEGSSLSDLDVFAGILKGWKHTNVEEMYETYIKNMRKDSNDSSYFEGEIIFKIEVNNKGNVGILYIESSTTGNKTFDNDLIKRISRWTFNKSDGYTTFTLPIRFERTKHSGKKIERKKLEVEGGVAPRHGGNI